MFFNVLLHEGGSNGIIMAMIIANICLASSLEALHMLPLVCLGCYVYYFCFPYGD